MDGRNAASVRIIGKIWITKISIVSLFNFFVSVVVFIINILSISYTYDKLRKFQTEYSCSLMKICP